MIADLFDLLSAALAFATETFISLINASGMPFAAFITMLCGFLALNIVLGTLRMRAFGYMGDTEDAEEFSNISEEEYHNLEISKARHARDISNAARLSDKYGGKW